MTLLDVFRVALYTIGVAALVMTSGIVATRVIRRGRDRRAARLAAEVRPLVLAAIEEGATAPALTGRRTRAAESIAISLLPKLRGADRDALTLLLDEGGVIDHALAGLKSTSAARRQRSVELLGNAGYVAAERQVAPLVDDRDRDVRIAAARALGRLGGPGAVDDLFRGLADRRIPANTASMAILRIGTVGAPSIVAATRSDVAVVRSTAAELAGSLGLMVALPSIEALLDDPERAVRTSAARALGRLSMPSSAAPLIERLERALELPVDRSDDDFLVALVDALGSIGHRSCIPVVESCFARRHRLSMASSRALSSMGVRRSMRSKQERATGDDVEPAAALPSGGGRHD